MSLLGSSNSSRADYSQTDKRQRQKGIVAVESRNTAGDIPSTYSVWTHERRTQPRTYNAGKDKMFPGVFHYIPVFPISMEIANPG